MTFYLFLGSFVALFNNNNCTWSTNKSNSFQMTHLNLFFVSKNKFTAIIESWFEVISRWYFYKSASCRLLIVVHGHGDVKQRPLSPSLSLFLVSIRLLQLRLEQQTNSNTESLLLLSLTLFLIRLLSFTFDSSSPSPSLVFHKIEFWLR